MIRPSCAHIVETFIGYDRETIVTPLSWVEWRSRFFELYTLRSLLNQTDQDFRIFVQIGERQRDFLEKFFFHPRLTICAEKGRSEYAKFDTDYIAITRIDSDDLFHRENIAEIKRSLRFSAKREVLVYKTRIVWDMINGYVISAHPRASSPFVTHIFPRSIYQNFERFKSEHFRSHGKDGAGDLTGIPLREGRVCVTKHGRNISLIKRAQSWPKFRTKEDFRAMEQRILKQYPFVKIHYGSSILPILSQFGMTEELIRDEEGLLSQ